MEEGPRGVGGVLTPGPEAGSRKADPSAPPPPGKLREVRSGPEVPVGMEPDEFRRLGYELVDRIAEHLRSLTAGPVTAGSSPQVVREILGADRPLPPEGENVGRVIQEAAELLFTESLFNGHPRFFGYITGSPAPVGMLADLLAAAVNPNVGAWTLSPMASEIEGQTVRWVAELIGYPTDCGGLMVSGGNQANFVAFLAARAAAGFRWRIRETGLTGPGSSPLRVYCSHETHTWIEKAADLFGLGTEAVRLIETDEGLRMNPEAVRRAIRDDRSAGHLPFLVVGNGGSTSTGAVDPLPELADLCEEEQLWFHVDGAYGGFAATVPGAPPELAALARADSVAVDPHKWLYSPLEAGCALVRSPEALRDTFAYHPPYYHFGVEATNYVDFGPQNSRGFRALKVWLALRQAGGDGYRRMIAQDMALARHLFDLADAHPELEALTQGLSVTAFRYVPPDLRDRLGSPEVEDRLNELNKEIQDRMERGGEAFVSNAVIGGKYALRACIVNFNTIRRDVEALQELVVRMGRAVAG
jgi:glutamate/tyrosine decarboxylase-like PLP-dependent enzyme